MPAVPPSPSGCHEKDPLPELNVGKTEYTLGAAEGRTATVSFNTNVEWALSVSYEGSETDWLTATPTSGTPGENTLELTAKENDGDTTRTAYVDFLFGEKRQRLNITQTGATNLAPLFDPEFARILKEKGYIPDAEKILPKDIAGITALDVSWPYPKGGPLSSLKGIEYFESLERLYCYSNQLTALDVSQNTRLEYLDCSYNPGDGISVFPVTAWFGNDAIPSDFTKGSWTYGDRTIYIDYRKAE